MTPESPKAVPSSDATQCGNESRAVVIPNAPDEIWLNVGDLFEPTDGKFDFDGFSEGEVTWSAEKQDRDDIKYVRADIAAFRAVASNLAARLDSSIDGASEAEQSDQPPPPYIAADAKRLAYLERMHLSWTRLSEDSDTRYMLNWVGYGKSFGAAIDAAMEAK